MSISSLSFCSFFVESTSPCWIISLTPIPAEPTWPHGVCNITSCYNLFLFEETCRFHYVHYVYRYALLLLHAFYFYGFVSSTFSVVLPIQAQTVLGSLEMNLELLVCACKAANAQEQSSPVKFMPIEILLGPSFHDNLESRNRFFHTPKKQSSLNKLAAQIKQQTPST